MFADPKWFTRRKYTGWGITPKTWQGWLYLAVWLAILMVAAYLMKSFHLSQLLQTIIMLAIVLILGIDALDIARKMDLDERERLHEAYAERNCCWAMVAVLSLGLIVQIIMSTKNNNLADIDPFIVVGLIIGTIVKAISNWYYSDK
ncbi:hypothetical protein EP47_04175 [Legionella norrlandica]|uniref:Uncharacterized protein n=1 Tax=Legionella norrlandica TaxID=1498499 RepID=A0A0A2SXS7_9GAMM|nr:hypothetical protein [Legionella norrlandica]KGP64254.1 hypothetical protein EP47_04175 [Legionella norrlandica]